MRIRRFSNEGGEEAGWRNWGRFFLSLIPAALGGAAVVWITAAVGWIDLTRTIRMQQRTMQSVGIAAVPSTPIHVLTHDDRCLKVEAAYMDGDWLQFYAKNTCQRWLVLPNYSYRVKAHDGTVIRSGKWAFDGDKAIGPNEGAIVEGSAENIERHLTWHRVNDHILGAAFGF